MLSERVRLRIVALLSKVWGDVLAGDGFGARRLKGPNEDPLKEAGIRRHSAERIAVFSVAAIIMESTAGLVSAFATVALAQLWEELTSLWLKMKQFKQDITERLENRFKQLREAIERLRQSLKS